MREVAVCLETNLVRVSKVQVAFGMFRKQSAGVSEADLAPEADFPCVLQRLCE